MKNKFSPYLCGFRKNHNAQYSLLKMIENSKKQLGNGEKVGVFFMDLSKAFDTINHNLLCAKPKAYGFSNQAYCTAQKMNFSNKNFFSKCYQIRSFPRIWSHLLKKFLMENFFFCAVLQSYLCNRFQRSIINGSFSSWNEITIFLNDIFLNGIFLFTSKCQLCNYPDDNTLYKSRKNMRKNKNDLEMDFMILHKWFPEKHMVLNPGKCHHIVIVDGDPTHKNFLNNNEISSSDEEKLLGILLDSKLNFDSHITSLCKKAGQKLSALARINHYLSQHQKLLLLNSVGKSQFSYCPLI